MWTNFYLYFFDFLKSKRRDFKKYEIFIIILFKKESEQNRIPLSAEIPKNISQTYLETF